MKHQLSKLVFFLCFACIVDGFKFKLGGFKIRPSIPKVLNTRTNRHTYPISDGLSGAGMSNPLPIGLQHTYPASPGMSGNSPHLHPSQFNGRSALDSGYNRAAYEPYLGKGRSSPDDLLTGLVLWNAARSVTNAVNHDHHHENTPNDTSSNIQDCSLTVKSAGSVDEVKKIHCKIALSFHNFMKANEYDPLKYRSSSSSCTISHKNNGDLQESTVPCDIFLDEAFKAEKDSAKRLFPAPPLEVIPLHA